MFQSSDIGQIARHLAGLRWVRVVLCVLYATTMVLQLNHDSFRHVHHGIDMTMAVAGSLGTDPCESSHDGAIKHCHTISSVSLCAPVMAQVATYEPHSALPNPPRIDLVLGRVVRPQFRPPQSAQA